MKNIMRWRIFVFPIIFLLGVILAHSTFFLCTEHAD